MKTATYAGASFAILVAALFCSVNQVRADQITYSLTTTATGTLDGSSFKDAEVTVTLTGDTSRVVSVSGFLVNTGTAKVNVSGVGTDTFTDPIVVVNSFAGNPGVLFFDNSPSSQTGVVGQIGSIFSTYDLTGPFGPLSGTGGVASGSMVTPMFLTTGGDLTWATGQGLGTSTFSAVVGPVPEPATLMLLGSGLMGIMGMTFRRRRSA